MKNEDVLSGEKFSLIFFLFFNMRCCKFRVDEMGFSGGSVGKDLSIFLRFFGIFSIIFQNHPT
jgi:hypothetical protein